MQRSRGEIPELLAEEVRAAWRHRVTVGGECSRCVLRSQGMSPWRGSDPDSAMGGLFTKRPPTHRGRPRPRLSRTTPK